MYHAASTKIYETVDIPTSSEGVRWIINPINGSLNLFSCVIALQVINVLTSMFQGNSYSCSVETLGLHPSGRGSRDIKRVMLKHNLLSKCENSLVLGSDSKRFHSSWKRGFTNWVNAA